jgi:hypothetical protein
MAGLFRVGAVLGKPHPLAAYRKDGSAAIHAFEASGKKYDGPQVLVLDYMALRVFEDGSSLELVHTIERAQSDEAVNRLAEVDIPNGAQVLTLRVVKPDGRTLEPDGIANKSSVSLPSVARGDYVELEYLQTKPPAEGFPGGYLGDRFYFQSFEIAFHHSELVLILPEGMPYQLDPRGAGPTPQVQVRDGLRAITLAVDHNQPLIEEPNSVPAREFIPSTRLAVKADYAALVESLRDVLVDRDVFDPYYKRLSEEIVGDAAASDWRLRAERLYAWVLANIDNTNDVFAQAAPMLRGKAGNRTRVLHYLLGLAGVPSELALARTVASDRHESQIADAEIYDHLLLRVHGPAATEPVWLFTSERWAPFGFIPAVLRSQSALLLEPAAPKVTVSDGLSGPDMRRLTVRGKLAADNSVELDVTEALHGGDAVAWRGQLEQIPKAELSRRMEQDYVARLFPGASLGSLDIQEIGRAHV